jgi:hypothetical protein
VGYRRERRSKTKPKPGAEYAVAKAVGKASVRMINAACIVLLGVLSQSWVTD